MQRDPVFFYNVPGNVNYREDLPLDVIVNSIQNYVTRGYWWSRDPDGQLVFNANENALQDSVYITTDPDGTPVINYDPDLATEFSYTPEDSSIRTKRYS